MEMKYIQGWSGKDRKRLDMSKLFKEYANDTMMEGVALKAAMMMPVLLFQHSHYHSKSRENERYLERRLGLWRDGQIPELMNEGISVNNNILVL